MAHKITKLSPLY